MKHGDRVITESGEEVEFAHQRNSSKAPKVVSLRDALIVAVTCTTLFGAITVFALRSLIREEVGIHNNDTRAHPAAMESVHDHVSRQNGEAIATREVLERVGRIEIKMNQSSETIARIEERLKIHDFRVTKR